MTFLLMDQAGQMGSYKILLRTENGTATGVANIFDETLAARIRDLLNREGLVDVALAPDHPDRTKETP